MKSWIVFMLSLLEVLLFDNQQMSAELEEIAFFKL